MRVAWTMLPGSQEGSWRPHWERMLTLLAEAVPAEWQVLVMADRGLYAAWLFAAIQAKGWHPFLRGAPHHAVRHLPRSGIELGGGSRVIQPT